MAKELNGGNLIRGLGILFLGIVILGLVYNMFFQMGPGWSGTGGMHGNMMDGSYGMTGGYGTGYGFGGFSLTGLLAGILLFFIKILSILLVVGLFVGFALVLKQYFWEDGDLNALWAGFNKKVSCQNCSKSIRGNWDYCPNCGDQLKEKTEIK